MAYHYVHAAHHGRHILYVSQCLYGVWQRETHSVPVAVVLYKRLVLGEPRRALPTDLNKHGSEKVASIYTAGEGKGEQGEGVRRACDVSIQAVP